MKQVITLFRTRGVNPETVLVRRENKPQTVVLQCLPWIAMGTTCNNNIQRPQVNLLDKTEIESRGHRDQTCGCQGGDRERDGLESAVRRCKASCLECINKVLLYSTGNYIQTPGINHKGKEYKKRMYICIQLSLCCTAEISTTL